MSRRARRSWEAGIRALHAEAGGVLRLMLVTPADTLALIAAAVAGDGSALAYMRALDTFRCHTDGPADDPPLCLTCYRRLRADVSLLGLVIPPRDDAAQCLVVGLCGACTARHQDRATVETSVMDALRRMLWRDLRPIASPSGIAGRACRGRWPMDIGGIASMLADRIEPLCAELLPAGIREGIEWRIGSVAGEPGRSMAVHLRGAKAGVWCDWAAGIRGEALDLAAQVLFRGDKRCAGRAPGSGSTMPTRHPSRSGSARRQGVGMRECATMRGAAARRSGSFCRHNPRSPARRPTPICTLGQSI